MKPREVENLVQNLLAIDSHGVITEKISIKPIFADMLLILHGRNIQSASARDWGKLITPTEYNFMSQGLSRHPHDLTVALVHAF